MALVQSQSAHRSASPYGSANPTPNATISPHSTSTTTRSTDATTSQRNGKRSVSSGHVKMASAGGTRVPVPPLLGNAPPFLDGRNRVSSNPSRPIPPRSASQPSFPNPQFQSRTISSSSTSPSATSPNNHQYAFPQSQSQYPYNPAQSNGGGMMQNGWNGAPSGGGGFGYLSPDQQHQAMLMQQAQYQQQQWQAEMMRGQPNQQYDWSQQAQNNSARRRATSGPALSPPFVNSSHPPSPVPSFTQYPNGNIPSLPPGAMSPQFGNAYPTPPASIEGRDVGTGSAAGRSVEGFHPYRRGGGKNESAAGVVAGGATTTNAPAMSQGGGSKSKVIQHGSSSSSSSNSNSSTPSHARTDSTASSFLSARNFPPLPKSTASTTTLQDPKSSSREPIRVSTTTTAPRVTTTVPSPTKERSRTISSTSIQRAENRERLSFIDTSGSSSTARSSSPVPPTTSSAPSTSPTATSSGSNSNATSNSAAGGKKPSPLSQQVRGHTNSMETERGERPGTPGTYRRRDGSGGKESDEESDDTALQIVAAPPAASREPERNVERVVEKEKKSGMKYKLKKAFSINSGLSGVAAGEGSGAGGKSVPMPVGRRGSTSSNETTGGPPRLSTHQIGNSTASLASTSTRPEGSKPPPSAGSRRFGILNSKLNASTDNISISSTVSSASVMIRKLGQMGQLARRSSLMSLTKAFKSNSSTKDSESASVAGASTSTSTTSKLVKKDRKSEAASASVAHVTVELDSPSQTPSSLGSMSPAAALAKKHQLQYAEQEATAAALAARSSSPITRFDVHARNGSSGSISNGVAGASAGKSEEVGGEGKKDKSKGKKKWGFGSLSSSSSKQNLADQEEDDKRSIAGSVASASGSGVGRRGSFDNLASAMGGRDEIYEDGPGEIEFVRLENGGAEEERFMVIPPGPRRDARPTRGILKGARSYNQEDYALPRPAFPRNRANSADNATQLRASSTSLQSPLSAFEGAIPTKDPIIISSPSASVTKFPTPSPNDPPPSSPYLNQTQNHSAPVLHSQYPLLPPNPRSTTLPSFGRRITFAANLSVHTTWPAEVYDRRAEPAACNRLTPAFAQRIKEELNAYKMEEMEVHQMSRQLTHFFV